MHHASVAERTPRMVVVTSYMVHGDRAWYVGDDDGDDEMVMVMVMMMMIIGDGDDLHRHHIAFRSTQANHIAFRSTQAKHISASQDSASTHARCGRQRGRKKEEAREK